MAELISLTVAVIVGAAIVELMLATAHKATAAMQLISASAVNKLVASMDQASPVREIEHTITIDRVQIDALKLRPAARKVAGLSSGLTSCPILSRWFLSLRRPAGRRQPGDSLAGVPQPIVERTVDALLAHVSAEQVGTTNFINVSAEIDLLQARGRIATRSHS